MNEWQHKTHAMHFLKCRAKCTFSCGLLCVWKHAHCRFSLKCTAKNTFSCGLQCVWKCADAEGMVTQARCLYRIRVSYKYKWGLCCKNCKVWGSSPISIPDPHPEFGFNMNIKGNRKYQVWYSFLISTPHPHTGLGSAMVLEGNSVSKIKSWSDTP